jgi:nucleotide-binding universal stress UspA family protein
MAGPIRNILVYVDGTEESVTAAQYAILLAKSTEADLHAAYVINTRALNDLVKARIFLREEQEEYQHDIEADADKYLNHIEALSSQRGVEIGLIKASGSVNQEIKRIVKEQDVDLLVLGELSHVRSRRDEFYNEAERAMRGVKCSVLIVKDEDRVYDLFETGLD